VYDHERDASEEDAVCVRKGKLEEQVEHANGGVKESSLAARVPREIVQRRQASLPLCHVLYANTHSQPRRFMSGQHCRARHDSRRARMITAVPTMIRKQTHDTQPLNTCLFAALDSGDEASQFLGHPLVVEAFPLAREHLAHCGECEKIIKIN
jgi:hypothetical protein